MSENIARAIRPAVPRLVELLILAVIVPRVFRAHSGLNESQQNGQQRVPSRRRRRLVNDAPTIVTFDIVISLFRRRARPSIDDASAQRQASARKPPNNQHEKQNKKPIRNTYSEWHTLELGKPQHTRLVRFRSLSLSLYIYFLFCFYYCRCLLSCTTRVIRVEKLARRLYIVLLSLRHIIPAWLIEPRVHENLVE